VLAIAVIILVTLGVIGTGLEARLKPTSLSVPGTPSANANAMLKEHFGESAPFAILLRGPGPAIDRQGPELIRTLRRDPKVTTLSPWDQGSVQRLRPSPRRALILVDFHVGITEAVNVIVPRLNRILAEQIHSPVQATQSGFATLSRAIQEESINASETGELIAIPALLIVLLLVFRSPIAAAIPLGFGATTVFASRGLLYFLTSWLGIDAFALTVCTMMGLALGVDYSLLMVSRFREELAAGADPLDAAWATRATAGRTTIFAGSTLAISMIVALFVVPGALLASLAGTVTMVAALSVLVATVVGPALLVLLGPNVDRWRVGSAPDEENSRLMTFVNAALRRPAAVAALIGAVVLILAAPAIALKTGPPSQEQLAQNDPARLDAELINRAIGPGWDSPFQVIATSDRGPITNRGHLGALTRWQRRVADLPGVQAVIGPAQATRPVAPLQETGNSLLASEGKVGPVNQLGRLGRSLTVAAGGVKQLRSGLSEAAAGAGLLSQGSEKAAVGALTISHGLAKAGAGTQRAVTALDKLASGSKKLAAGQKKATEGALWLKIGLHNLYPNLRNNGLKRSRKLQKLLNQEANVKVPPLIGPAKVGEEQLKNALQQLQEMTVGKTDSHYGPALEAVEKATAAVSGTDPVSGQPYAAGYAGLPTELTELQKRLVIEYEEAHLVSFWWTTAIREIKKQASVAKQLHAGLVKLEGGGNELASGAARLASASRSLDSGIARLAVGAASLAGGVSRLGGGASALEEHLASGYQRAAPLQSGLGRASVRVISGHTKLKQRIVKVHRQTPGLFHSGYFVLSALDGAPPRQREAAGSTIDLRHGGQAATMLVVSDYSFNTPGSIALNRRLDGMTPALERSAGVSAGVAGGAAELNDYTRVTKATFPDVVAAITLATFLVLVIVLRAIPLAAIAVGLNLATVGVAFGVLTLLFNVPAGWPLGGHKYVDAVGAVMIFGVVFGLSIDYAVFLLTRMRESFDRDRDHAAAVDYGLEKTARVITGAAAIMMAVFIAFAAAPIATVSQTGIGLTVAVLLDATVVRIVLLPALMLLIGERVWWLPRPLERVLPRFNV
jgi:putative drug exporter of the RND superfamily